MTGDQRLGLGLAAGGGVGLVAAAVLLVERFRLADDPAYIPSCSVNPVLSCGSIMESWQAALLGFPNPVIGVAAFPVVITTGMALLSGAGHARWFWQGLQVGVLTGLALVGWLVFQSLYRIGAGVARPSDPPAVRRGHGCRPGPLLVLLDRVIDMQGEAQ